MIDAPIIRISHHCWQIWSRFDPAGLRAFMQEHRLIVRVPVERQRRPEPTIG